MKASPSSSPSSARPGQNKVRLIACAAWALLLMPGCEIPDLSPPDTYEWRNQGYDYSADARNLSDERYHRGSDSTRSKSSQGKSEHGKSERSSSRSSGSDSGSSSSSSDISSSSSDAVSSRESGGGSDDKGSSSSNDSKSDNNSSSSSSDKDSSPSGGIGGRERN